MMTASRAQDPHGSRRHVIKHIDCHHGVGKESCDAGLTRAAPPRLRDDSGWHMDAQVLFERAFQDAAHERVAAFEREQGAGIEGHTSRT